MKLGCVNPPGRAIPCVAIAVSSKKPLYDLQDAAAAAAAFFGQLASMAFGAHVQAPSNAQDEQLSSHWQLEAMISCQPGTDAMDCCEQLSWSVPSSNTEPVSQDMLHLASSSAAASEGMHSQPAAQLQKQLINSRLGPFPASSEDHALSGDLPADDTVTPGENVSACEDLAGMLCC